MRKLCLWFSMFLLTGCLSTGSRITDFSDRSVGYGWLDIKKIDANRLHSVVLYQYTPKSDKPYYHAAVKKFEGGYLYYTFGLLNGAYGAYSATGQFCLGLCSNTIHTYTFGKQGDNIAKVRIDNPNVYSFGSYALKEIKTGLFKPGQFEAVPAEKAPTDEQMLREILKETKGNAVIAARVQSAIDAL